MQSLKLLDKSNSIAKDDDNMEDEDKRTIFCANLSEKVTEELLYELFLQSGPIERVRIPNGKDGRQSNFGFITYIHACSVPYTLELFKGIKLFNRELALKNRISNSNRRSNHPSKWPEVKDNTGQNVRDNISNNNSLLMGFNPVSARPYFDMTPHTSNTKMENIFFANPFKRDPAFFGESLFCPSGPSSIKCEVDFRVKDSANDLSKHPSRSIRPHNNHNNDPYCQRRNNRDNWDQRNNGRKRNRRR